MNNKKDLIEIDNSEGEVVDQNIDESNAQNKNLQFESDMNFFDKLIEYKIDKNDFDHLKVVLDALENHLDNYPQEVTFSYELLKSKFPPSFR